MTDYDSDRIPHQARADVVPAAELGRAVQRLGDCLEQFTFSRLPSGECVLSVRMAGQGQTTHLHRRCVPMAMFIEALQKLAEVTKQCRMCQRVLGLAQFPRDWRNKENYRPYCRRCENHRTNKQRYPR